MDKHRTISSEVELAETVALYLGSLQVHELRLKLSESPGYLEGGADFYLSASLDKLKRRFAVDCRLHPDARMIDRLRDRGWEGSAAPLLATPDLSEALVDHCRESNVSCLDLNGRLYLRHHGLLVDRPRQARQYRSAAPEPDLFAAKSCRLARAWLGFPERAWTQQALAAATECSPALVSRLTGEYVRLGWVRPGGGGWRLVKPDSLLDAWMGSDAWSKRGMIQQFSTLERDPARLAEQAAEFLGKDSGTPAFTQWFAASRRFPHTELPVVSAYCRHLLSPSRAGKLGWREVDNGGRLWLILPSDSGVFQFTQRVDGFDLVCDAQIYLDLMQVGLRGPDAAQALRAWEGFRHP